VSFNFATSVAVQNDGKIVVTGYANGDFALARYNNDGSLDNTFSDDGKQTTDFASETDVAQSAVIQKDGRIVVAGYTWNGSDNDFALAMYNTDGSPDSTFSGDGKQTTAFNTDEPFLGSNDYGYSVVIQDDGKIMVAGSVNLYYINFLVLARYNTD